MARKLSERPKNNNGDVKVARNKQQGVKLPTKQSEVVNSAENQPILQRLHPNQRAETVASLGSAHGNRHVQRVVASMRQSNDEQSATSMPAPPSSSGLETKSSTISMPFHASIKRSAASELNVAAPAVAAMSRQDTSDDGKDKDTKHEDLFEKMIEDAEKLQEKNSSKPETSDPAAAEAATEEAKEPEVLNEAENQLNQEQMQAAESVAEPFMLPDVEIPMLEEYEKNDALEGNFSYQSSIKKDGPAPTGFGTTRSFNVKLTNIVVKPTEQTYEISATLVRPITYQVRSGSGPNGQVDIKSETASEITAANYQQVADDLMPNPGDLGGRSPRNQYWAEDLTLRHEEMHAKDDKDNGAKVMAAVMEWLGDNSAADAGEIWQLLNMIPAQFAVEALEEQSIEEAEKKAYGDGLSSYQLRSRAIKTRGDAGKYS